MICLTNILLSLDEVMKRLDESHRVEVCCVKFGNAFDSVDLYQLY